MVAEEVEVSKGVSGAGVRRLGRADDMEETATVISFERYWSLDEEEKRAQTYCVAT